MLQARDRKKFGLLWERDAIEHDRALNDDFVTLDPVPDLHVGSGPFQSMVIEGDNDGEGANDPVTEIRYDGRDWQREIIDPAGRATTFDPRPNGQPWHTTLPMARLKTEVQDGDGRPVSGTVPGSDSPRTTGMAYDTAPSGYPRVTTTTADGLTSTVVQDRDGNTRFHTNRKGDTWEFRYDGLGRRTHVITPLDAANNRAHITEYHHRGAVKKITEPSG